MKTLTPQLVKDLQPYLKFIDHGIGNTIRCINDELIQGKTKICIGAGWCSNSDGIDGIFEMIKNRLITEADKVKEHFENSGWKVEYELAKYSTRIDTEFKIKE